MLGLSLSVPITLTASACYAHVSAELHTAQRETAGLGDVRTVLELLDALQTYRVALAPASPFAEIRRRADRDAVEAAIATLTPISADLAAHTNVRRAYDAVLTSWRRLHATPRPAVDDVSVVAARALRLIVAISDESGITYDPTVEGLNLGDALTARFPPALESALRAASAMQTGPVAGAAALAARLDAARWLATAQSLNGMGADDVSDAVQQTPAVANPLRKHHLHYAVAFNALDGQITAQYVVRGKRGRGEPTPETIDDPRDALRVASAVLCTTLVTDFAAGLSARAGRAQRQRIEIVAFGAAALAFDAGAMLALTRITRRRYRRALERARAARVRLESQLAQARVERALLNEKARFHAVFDRAPHGMVLFDRLGTVIDVNDAARAMLDANGDMQVAPALVDESSSTIDKMFAGTLTAYQHERNVRSADGIERWLDVAISLVRTDDGTPLFAIAIISDISDRKAMEARLIFDATHDALTGLPNRKRFMELLQIAIDRRSVDDRAFCVIFIDFNDFKTINDSLGHSAGDRFLVGAAGRLRAALRTGDVVARLGGDEFGILLYEDIRESQSASIEVAIARLQQTASKGIEIDGLPVATSASFGVATASAAYISAEEMLRDADTAMYQAKRQGMPSYVVFDRAMHERVMLRMQLAGDLSRALERKEFELLYQPIVALADGRIVGCEALLRWHRGSDGSIILPADFIPLAEEGGTIVDIDRWVTAAACDQLREWRETGILSGERAFTMHLNLAVPDVHHRDLVTHLRCTLERTRVPARFVRLEITESVVLENTAHTRATLDELKRLGLSLCIDDFGTGYSSLRYLHELPLNGFKIDRSFVGGAADGLANAPIVEMLLALGRTLRLTVIAEGIETAAQWDALRALGCELGQGYHFAPPVGAARLAAMLHDRFMPAAAWIDVAGINA